MRGVILLAIIFAFVTLACGAGDELPTLAATAAIQEAEPPATATDTPGAEGEPTNTDEPTKTSSLTVKIYVDVSSTRILVKEVVKNASF